MADSGGSDWEVVSLTASTYAAAPGPVSPIHDAHKTESPLLLVPNPPVPPAHFFMSQHFNLPKQPLNTHLENSGCQELESGPAVPDGDASDYADHLDMPRPENYREGERDDVLVLASPAGNGQQVEGGGGDELQRTTTPCSLPDATAGSDAAAVGSATLPAPAPAATATVAAPASGGVAWNAGQAWWEKTFSFPRQHGNGGTEPLAFRFVFVAGKLQLQEDHLSTDPEFVGVHGQTKKISCTANEPLGQVKVGILGGGSPVSQQG